MNADGQGDSVSLNKEEKSSGNDATTANKVSSQDGCSSVPKVDCEEVSSSVITSSASNVELQATVDEETEQTIKPAEKEKALDVDSELDFELKWDDDLNPDDQSKIDTDAVSNNEREEASNDVVMEQEHIHKPSITEEHVEDTTNCEQVPDGKDDGERELLNTAGEVFNLKIDLISKVAESDTNSLDEHLVYSDVEAPEVEEKDLLDELDAHISDNTLINAKLDEGVNTPEAPKTGENIEQSASQNDLVSAAMDVDDDIILLPVKKEEIPDVNDTLSSNTEMETSTYEVNNEHGLANPDVMIEIPTQDFMEGFDDSEDGEQYDEDILLDNETTGNNKDASPTDKDGISVEIPVSEDTSSEKTEEKTQSIPTEQSHVDIILEATHSGTITTSNDDVSETKPTSDDDLQPTIKPEPIADDDVELTVETKPTTINDVLPTAEQKLTTDTDVSLKAESKPTTTDDVQPMMEQKPTTINDIQSTDEMKLDDNIQPTGVTVAEESSLETSEVTKEVEACPAELAPNIKETDLCVSSPVLELPKDLKELEISKDLEKSQVAEAKESSTSGNLVTKEFQDDENVGSPELLEPKKVTEAEAEVLNAAVLEAKNDLEKSDSDEEEQPSTSKYLLREYSDVTEVTDSLGLLAESSTVMDDDEEQEQEDDDDDFDQDDESNQMTTEHSEDSNAPQSETDASPSMDVDDSPSMDKEEFTFPKVVEVTTSEAEARDDAMVEERVNVAANETELAVEALLRSEPPEDGEPTKDVSEEDVSDVDKQPPESEGDSKLRRLLLKDKEPETVTPAASKSPSKMKKLEITKTNNELNFVDLEESSSEDDIQEVEKQVDPEQETEGMTSVNIPDEVEVMAASAGSMSAMRHGDGEVVISGVPKPPPHKPARLNTSEVSIKTTQVATEAKSLPDSGAPSQDSPAALKYGLEVFSLDSDDDEKSDPPQKKMTAIELDRVRQNKLCVNMYCTSDSTTPLLPCDARCATYYGVKRGKVCEVCMLAVAERTQGLIEGVKDFTPLLSLDMGQKREEFVEISDSDSEEEPEVTKDSEGALGEAGAIFLDEKLADMFNVTWDKFNMEERLREAENELSELVNKMEGECKEIDEMLTKGQQMTDKVRQELYNTFAHRRQELPAILIYDTLPHSWSGLEDGVLAYEPPKESRQSKRRIAAATEPPAKKPAIPLGYTPLDSDADTAQNQPKPATAEVPVQNEDDSADISVVRLSAEAAPAGLPPVGAAARPALRPGGAVFAMRNAYGTWHRAKVVEVHGKNSANFTTFRVKFEHKVKNPCKTLPGRCLAYDKPSDVRMTIGTRVIALFKDPNNSKSESYYSGIIAEIPNPVNNYRYLVFFDDGYAQYVSHSATRLVCEFAKLVWDEVHPFSRQFVRDYLRAYPERPMVRVHAGQSMKTEWNGKWWTSRVVKVDASLVQVHFEEDDRYEWIYRGSTRLAPLYMELQAAERQRARPLPRAQPGRRSNMPYVEYTRTEDPPEVPATTPQQVEQDIRRQRAVAKKSTALPPARAPAALDPVTSRVVHYTPKNSVRPKKMVTHECGPQCRRIGNPSLKDLRTYNPLAKPLLSGWDRHTSRFRWTKATVYVAPCGRRIRNNRELHRYLRLIESDLAVDLFDFGPYTNCLAEFVLNRCYNSKKDLSNGKERVPVPCVNYYDDSLPEFCLYSTQREPTTGVPLNLDPEFLCGCDCTDDCADKTKCACWQLTLEGARTIGFDSDDVGYQYKRLPEPLPSGIYECNSRCKCKQTCLNRVAQHPLQLKLQVFKTLNRGWGIRALNEVPRGGFICVYAGNLLTDATANLDGLIEGDEYLAELDYIEVVEQMKEGFEQDARSPEPGKKEDGETEFTESSSSGEEPEPRDHDNDDDDFRPAEDVRPAAVPEYSNRLRKRDKKDGEEKDKKENSEENCITISDDEELREPARFAAQTGMGAAGFVSKYKSVRAHFGEDEACYIMDAKVQGNIGRYLNHSCTPNVFVQNVFVDTHDPRFPWVAFFALAHVAAGTELTWNYNYDVGSVPGKVLYCHCGEPNCRGRLL